MLQVWKDAYTGVYTGTSQVLANVPAIELGKDRQLAFTVTADDGFGGNPSGSAVGTFQLWVDRGDGVFVRLTSTAITTELANMALASPTTPFTGVSSFSGFPFNRVKVIYVVGSGGGPNTRFKLTYEQKP